MRRRFNGKRIVDQYNGNRGVGKYEPMLVYKKEVRRTELSEYTLTYSSNFPKQEIQKEVAINEAGEEVEVFVNYYWHEVVNNYRKNSLTFTQIQKYHAMAEFNFTDLTACLNPKIPKRYNYAPCDYELQRLGVRFANLWDLAVRVGHSIPYIVSGFNQIIDMVEDKSRFLLNIGSKANYFEDIKFDHILRRYYPMINNMYLKSSTSTKVELVSEESFRFSEWFRTKKEAENFLIASKNKLLLHNHFAKTSDRYK